MQSNKLNVGLLGMGRISKKHVEALSFSTYGRLIATCEDDEQVLNSMSVESRQLSVSFDELLEQVDVVSILTESGNHFEHAKKALSHGKHVICEKPLALKISQCEKLVELANVNDVRLFTVKQNRYNDSVLHAKQHLDSGDLGDLIALNSNVLWCRPQDYYDQAPWRGTWLMDGGVLTNQAIHYVDLLQWFAGGLDSVFSVSRNVSANIQAEDFLTCIFQKNDSNLVATLTATTAIRPQNLEGSLTIIGTKGAIKIGGHALNCIDYAFVNEKPSVEDPNVQKAEKVDVYGNGHRRFYETVLESIVLGTPHELEGFEGGKSVALVNAAYASSIRGSKVQVSDRELIKENSPMERA